MIHCEHPEILHHLIDRTMNQSTHQFHKKFFQILKCLACNPEIITVEDNKKIMDIANFINIYI